MGALPLQCRPSAPAQALAKGSTPAQQGSQMPHVTLCVGACSLLEYDTQTKEVKVLLDHLRIPNGVQLSPAEDFVLVAALAMVRIRRCVSWRV